MDQEAVSSAEASAKAGLDQESKKPRIRDLYSWRSLSRPAQKYPKEFFKTIGAIALLLSIIFAFFQEWFAIIVTWAAVFLAYQLSRIAPEEVDHKITTEGLISMDHAYLWPELGPFWFTEKTETNLLHIAHRNVFGQIVIVIAKSDQEKIKEILAEYLPFIEVPEKSAVDKLSDWFSKKFPLQGPKPTATTKVEPTPPPTPPQPSPAV